MESVVEAIERLRREAEDLEPTFASLLPNQLKI